VKYIALLFLVTRSALLILGVLSRTLLAPYCDFPARWQFTNHHWLNMWAVWDSGWYLQVAEQWYPQVLEAGKTNYGFFPLYPLLMRLLGAVIGSKLIAGIIISNVCLIGACVFIFKLVKLSADEDTALRSVKYLFLFPSAFILSGVFSEPLFLLLAIMCFYYAEKGQWIVCGAMGYLASLTRSNGVLIALPIAFEYLRSKDFKLRNIRWDVFALVLIPLGSLTFAVYCYHQTGNLLAYAYAKKTGWYLVLDNPFKALSVSLKSGSPELVFNAIFSIVVILALSLFYKKTGFSYWLFGMLWIFLPLAYGIGDASVNRAIGTGAHTLTSMHGMARFCLDVFPLYILLAKLSVNDSTDRNLTIFLAILQGGLAVFWAAGIPLVV